MGESYDTTSDAARLKQAQATIKNLEAELADLRAKVPQASQSDEELATKLWDIALGRWRSSNDRMVMAEHIAAHREAHVTPLRAQLDEAVKLLRLMVEWDNAEQSRQSFEGDPDRERKLREQHYRCVELCRTAFKKMTAYLATLPTARPRVPDKVIEAAPTPESTERARTCAEEIGDLILEAIYQEREEWKSSSNTEIATKIIALEFDRIAIEALDKPVGIIEDILMHLIDIGQGAALDEARKVISEYCQLRAQLVEHPRQGAALDAAHTSAGEGE